MNNRKVGLIAIIIILLSFISCNNDKVEFTEKDNHVIDSIYKLKRKELKGRIDTLCDSVYQVEYPLYIDSIKKIRKKEILDLIGK